jgi:hypothetical protein
MALNVFRLNTEFSKNKNTSICLRKLYLFKENGGDFLNKKKNEKEKVTECH